MIYTLTLNPSIDYEMSLSQFQVAHTNRSTHENYRLGGKGINVSCVLNTLGQDSQVLGFVGGFVGEQILRLIHEQDLNERLIHLENGISRINVKVLGKYETEINGEGPLIEEYEIKKLYDQLSELKHGDLLILSGSIPKCLDDKIYETILSKQIIKGVCCIVDASKDSLVNTLKYHPFLIKPNLQECEEIFHKKLTTTNEIISVAYQLREMGAINVMISRGQDGAIFVDEYGNLYESSGLTGKCVSSVGCGDSMVGGFVAAYLKDKNYQEAFKLALACGCASAFSEGLASREKIQKCYEKIEIKTKKRKI